MTVGLSPELLNQTFPFHVAFRSDGTVVQAGPVVGRVCTELVVGRSIRDAFRIDRPQLDLTFDAIRAHPRTVFVLEGLTSKLKLKGQMLYVEQDDLMLFLGSPWISELEELNAHGIKLDDFAVHDQVVDCLFLIRAQQAALSDVRKLASQQSVKLAQQQSNLLEIEKVARERLEKELELVQPKVIVALGSSAVLALTGKALPIIRSRGASDFGYITVHPSYILRLPDKAEKQQAYRDFVADLSKVRAMAEAA